ncbi:TlpA family protein disulfide reductase [Dyadobacter sandarakinus]|nr:TlpA disulfide reductase family protein [Dyadobacter sandarakinus]
MISLEGTELAKVRLDSAGKGVLEVEVNEPVFTYINNGKNMAASLLIAPGDDCEILAAEPGAGFPLHFAGDGAAVNQALNECQQLRSAFDKWNGTYSFQLEGNVFLQARDSLQKSYDQLIGKLKVSNDVTAEKLDLLKRHAAMHIIFYQYNFALGKDSSEIPQSVWHVVNQFPVDTIALKAGIFDYGMIASFYYNNKINNAIYEENNGLDEDTLQANFPLLVEEKIKAAHYPKIIENFLRVKSAHIQIGWSGLTPELRKLTKKLEQEISSAGAKSVIREDVARWEKLGPGKPAPDFSGMTPDSKRLALSDLRGKVVYVDVWATWCGPCVGAFPDSRKLQAKFKGNNRIAFLYVSIDRDTLAWQKMVVSGKVPAGHHMLNGPDEAGSVWNLYHLRGVPHYLLIDDLGRMVATHAPHPSASHTAEELQSLLAAAVARSENQPRMRRIKGMPATAKNSAW